MLNLKASSRANLAPLFAHQKPLSVVVDAILQGYCGTAVANAGSQAQIAQLTEVAPDLLLSDVFPTPTDFVERGIGFCALTGGQMICGATSAFICDGAIEIQIDIRRACRNIGLATAVGATLLVHCLEREIDPHRDAGAPASERVAEKLGYVPDCAYEWWVLRE